MFTWINNKLNTYRLNKAQETYEAGFKWAMVEYYIKNTDFVTIKNYCNSPIDETKFDEGARYAVRILEDSK